MDRWVRNRTWWWSMLFWSVGVLLTNAYKLYLRVCEDEGVIPRYKEQFEFRKAIAEYWINPELIEKERLQGARKRKYDDDSVSCMSPITNPFMSPTGSESGRSGGAARSTAFTDASLDEQGALSTRLDRSLDHFFERSPSKRPKCSLHWWAADKRLEKDIFHCPSCRVNLCVDCYGLFHRIPGLVSIKTKLCYDMQEDSRSGGNSRGTSRQL